MIEEGRLVIEKYPPKRQFLAEANRPDCGSYPFLHVDVCHDWMSTTELYDLLSHSFPPRHLPKKMVEAYCQEMHVRALPDFMYHSVMACEVTLNDRIETRDWKDPAHFVAWSSPQMELWQSDVTNEFYRMWIAWCKKMLNQTARHVIRPPGEKKERVVNPYAGLRFRVRIEFHD